MKRRMCSLVLAVVMLMNFSIPIAHAAGSGDNTKEIGITGSDVTRDAKPPREYYDLSKGTYTVDGTFEISIYSACYFKPNKDGKIHYSVVLRWQEEFGEYPILPTLTVECWDRTTNKQVSEATFESETTKWPFVPVIYSDNRVVYGLNTDHEYYFIFRKDIPGVIAEITGTIWH